MGEQLSSASHGVATTNMPREPVAQICKLEFSESGLVNKDEATKHPLETSL